MLIQTFNIAFPIIMYHACLYILSKTIFEYKESLYKVLDALLILIGILNLIFWIQEIMNSLSEFSSFIN